MTFQYYIPKTHRKNINSLTDLFSGCHEDILPTSFIWNYTKRLITAWFMLFHLQTPSNTLRYGSTITNQFFYFFILTQTIKQLNITSEYSKKWFFTLINQTIIYVNILFHINISSIIIIISDSIKKQTSMIVKKNKQAWIIYFS